MGLAVVLQSHPVRLAEDGSESINHSTGDYIRPISQPRMRFKGAVFTAYHSDDNAAGYATTE